MRSTCPLRSNCGPPWPRPRSGPFGSRNATSEVCASKVSRWTGAPSVESTWSVGGCAVNRTVRLPARTGLNVSADLPAATRLAAAGCATPPSSGTAAGAPETIGRTLRRTVAGLSDDTTISTGWPPIVMSVVCPRMMPPANATPAPAAVICLSASRRVMECDMTRILPEHRDYDRIDFSNDGRR